MKLLDAVNLLMPKLGERPVTSLTIKHPTLAIILPVIQQNKVKTLLEGWWFNEYDYNAPLNSDNEIVLGEDTISFVPKYSGVAVLRGSKLFNPKTLSFKFTSAVEGRVTQDVDFNDLPESAAQCIFSSAVVEAFATDLGVTQELQIYVQQAQASYSTMLSEHLKQKKYSTRRSPRWNRYISALQG